VEELVKNNLGYQILTDSGWESFDGLLLKGKKQTLVLQLERTKLLLTPDHGIFLASKTKTEARTLKPGQYVYTRLGLQKVVSVGLGVDEPVYDILNSGKNRRFFANDILVSNCEFIINDETLIAPAKLLDLQGHEPLYKTGQVRWYQRPKAGRTYVIGLDPSLGTGGDAAAIQIFEAETTEQVAEWRHNRTPIPEQVRILAAICAHINETVKDPQKIYFSIENNTIGEAALISIDEYGEENIQGYFLSDPHNGGNKRYRKGFNTTNKPKLAACNKLKTLIESGRMKVRSSSLVSELKTFVASGAGYAAKIGETDDLVMSTVLTVRMLQLLQTYDTSIDTQLRDHGDNIIPPMPFISVRR
jgi:hypothetical protein